MKIVFCLNHLCHNGGISVATVTKANALSEINGYEVYIIITDKIANEFNSNLSSRIKLIDLNINYYEYDWKSKWHLIKTYIIKGYKHKKLLQRQLREIDPDIVISVGQSEKYILPSIKGEWKLIREIHFASDYRRLQAKNFKERIFAYINEFYDYKWKIKGYDKIVLLTQEDKERNWKNNEKVFVIPNILTFLPLSANDNQVSKKIVSIGRLVSQKNYESLIKAFRYVCAMHPDWSLDIYGEGSQRYFLQNIIEKNSLSHNVKLAGDTKNPQEVLMASDIFVLSSYFEGFGLVLIEAMASGLPVVAYDCPCGPKDIISDGKDGFLIEPGNETQMAEKICYLIENPDIRKQMGEAAHKRAQDYSIDNILPKWLELFDSLRQ